MSTVIDQSLKAAHDARTEKLRIGWDAYHSILVDLASDQAVDPVELNLTLEMIGGRSESEVRSDVEKMQKRIALFNEYKELDQRTKELEMAQAENDAANAEFNRVTAELDAKCKAAYQKLQSAHANRVQSLSAEHDLISSCFSPVIKWRETELNRQIKIIADELRELQEKHLDVAERYSEAWNLQQTRRQISEMDEQLRQARLNKWPEGMPKAEIYTQRKETEKRLQKSVSLWQAKHNDLQQQLNEISSELSELRKQKLTP
jgi:uncharacterized protein YeaC (DUF1315 family)